MRGAPQPGLAALMRRITWESGGALAGETDSDAGLIAVMERWNDAVKQTVPIGRLLVWDPNEGWEPLCDFLGVEAPGEPLPQTPPSPAPVPSGDVAPSPSVPCGPSSAPASVLGACALEHAAATARSGTPKNQRQRPDDREHRSWLASEINAVT